MPDTRSQTQNSQPQNSQNQNSGETAAVIEPYKLSELFALIPEFEGDQISLSTFLNACDCAYNLGTADQKTLLVFHIKNKLKGRAAQLINSRSPETFSELKRLLETHFGDSRDLTALIQDLQRVRQLPGESPLTFFNRLQVLNAKMLSSVQKTLKLSTEQKAAQCTLIETMALNTLLTGLEPRLGQIIRACNPTDLIEAQQRIKRELQLSYFENQKFNKPLAPKPPQPIRRPPMPPPKCNTCGRVGHISKDCRSQQTQNFNPYQTNTQNSQNYPRPMSYQNQNSPQMRPNNNFQSQQRPQANINSQFRPFNPKNPGYFSNQHRAHYVNLEDQYQEEPYSLSSDEYYYDNYSQETQNYYENNYQYFDEYSSQPIDSQDYQNFLTLPHQNHPPNQQSQANTTSELEGQIQMLNLDDFNPNANFPEQAFL